MGWLARLSAAVEDAVHPPKFRDEIELAGKLVLLGLEFRAIAGPSDGPKRERPSKKRRRIRAKAPCVQVERKQLVRPSRLSASHVSKVVCDEAWECQFEASYSVPCGTGIGRSK
jgi:hypothetical protein